MLDVIGVLKDQELYEKALAEKQNRPANIYHGVYSTHPKNDDRLKTVIRAAKNLSAVQYRDNNQATYFNLIDGLPWGQSADQGVILQNRFMHAEMGIALQFPSHWQVTNNPNSLFARDHESGALAQLNLMTLGKSENSAGLLRRLTKNNKLSVENTAYGVTARSQASIAGKTQPARVSAINLDEKQVLFIAGTSAKDQFAATDLELRAINASFTRLSDKQIKSIKTPALKIIEAKVGENFASLASRSSINGNAESTLRLLNRAYPDGTISASQKLKIIELAN
jgi:predicted Zn-dependent protease